MEKSADRLKVLERIAEYEKLKKFNVDVEEDEPAKPILPSDVDYTNEKFTNRILTKLANTLGKMFFENQIKKKQFIIKEVLGLENAEAIKGGAIVTSNHFNIKDNYAIYKALRPTFSKKQRLYKVIKDSNYTNFTGPVRLMMRHANTLPLSSNVDTMKEFYKAVSILLKRGEKILVYPEQAMWWNYRKPRPLKSGAFKLAVKNNVPVLPIFITMQDSEILDTDGFYVQEYTIHILPALYPDETLKTNEAIKKLQEENYSLWVNVYEDVYKTKLIYENGEK